MYSEGKGERDTESESEVYVVLIMKLFFSWLQNNGSRWFSVDNLKGKQILLTF